MHEKLLTRKERRITGAILTGIAAGGLAFGPDSVRLALGTQPQWVAPDRGNSSSLLNKRPKPAEKNDPHDCNGWLDTSTMLPLVGGKVITIPAAKERPSVVFVTKANMTDPNHVEVSPASRDEDRTVFNKQKKTTDSIIITHVPLKLRGNEGNALIVNFCTFNGSLHAVLEGYTGEYPRVDVYNAGPVIEPKTKGKAKAPQDRITKGTPITHPSVQPTD